MHKHSLHQILSCGASLQPSSLLKLSDLASDCPLFCHYHIFNRHLPPLSLRSLVCTFSIYFNHLLGHNVTTRAYDSTFFFLTFFFVKEFVSFFQLALTKLLYSFFWRVIKKEQLKYLKKIIVLINWECQAVLQSRNILVW